MIPFEPDDTDWCFDEAEEYRREQNVHNDDDDDDQDDNPPWLDQYDYTADL